MTRSIDRRTFLKRTTATAIALAAAPLVSGRAVAGPTAWSWRWGTETPFAWRSSQSEKTLWECVYDPLIMRDPKTFAYRPGLATEWKPSNEMKTWTFKLCSGVKFHENYGELTADDVKFTIEQNLKPDAQGGSAPFFRTALDRIDTPDKLTVVMHFKTPLWEVPAQVSQFVGYRTSPARSTSRPSARRRRASDRHRALPPRRGPAGRLSSLRGGETKHEGDKEVADVVEVVLER